MRFHWLENVFLVARVQKGAFLLSLMYFQSPETFIRAKFLIVRNFFAKKREITRKNAKFYEKISHE